MKNVLVVVSLFAFASASYAANLSLTAASGGSSNIGAVAPGAVVSFSVTGLLSNDVDNMGLALAAFTLQLVDASDPSTVVGDLEQADMQLPTAMENFADLPGIRAGINNPAGYTGTEITDQASLYKTLVQIGGAQNTIMNTVDCTVDADCPGASNTCEGGTCSASAPFPLGTVETNIGHTNVELVSGTFVAPAVEGDYLLRIVDAFANVISSPQPPGIEYWATQQATITPGDITNLSFSVSAAPCDNVAVAFDDPADGVVDARQVRDIETGAILMGIETIAVSGVGVSTDTSCWSVCESQVEGAALSVSNVADNLNGTYTVALGRRITPGAVSRVTYAASGDTALYTSFPGDSNADHFTNAADITDMVACCMNGACSGAQSPVYSCDINHSLAVDSEDVVRLVDVHNGAGAFLVEWGAVAGPTLGCP